LQNAPANPPAVLQRAQLATLPIDARNRSSDLCPETKKNKNTTPLLIQTPNKRQSVTTAPGSASPLGQA